MNAKLVAELNEQIKHEFFSANYYIAMAAYCSQQGLKGFTNFFLVQAEEERFHAMKFFHFLDEVDEKVVITGYDDPQTEFDSLEGVFTAALEHEKFVTGRINLLMGIAQDDRHYASINLLQWFIDEQVEEEATMKDIRDRLRIVGKDGSGILMIDQELAARTFTPPPAE